MAHARGPNGTCNECNDNSRTGSFLQTSGDYTSSNLDEITVVC